MSRGGYEDLVKEQGAEVLLWTNEKDYQGDSWALIKKDGLLGFLTFGWGSCSGCDAYEAAYDDKEKLAEIGKGLVDGAHYEADAHGMLQYFDNKDWEAEWYYNEEELQEFLRDARVLLKDLATN